MEAYRDQYATLFKNGRNVVVIAVSVDADTTQAAWAREKEFPVLFASDAGGRVGQLYDAYDAKNAMDNRSLFVIGPDGASPTSRSRSRCSRPTPTRSSETSLTV